MTLALPRRRFLSLLGLGAAAAGVEIVAPEPVRRWFVASNAPVGLPPVLRHQSRLRGLTLGGVPLTGFADIPALGEPTATKCADPGCGWCAQGFGTHAPERRAGQHLFGIEPSGYGEMRKGFAESKLTREDFDALTERSAAGVDRRDWANVPMSGPPLLPTEKPETNWYLADTPEAREWLRRLEDDTIRDAAIEQRIDAEFSECVRDAGRRIRAAAFDGQPLFETAEAWSRNGWEASERYMSATERRPKPIGTVESIDPVTGLATVRLHAPLTGWRGTGTA